uniref:Glycosyltransferase 8 domain containing 2 n=1 Tax=Sparus aurata TaxID=8175 RepID=A0A671WQM2_SPAAU
VLSVSVNRVLLVLLVLMVCLLLHSTLLRASTRPKHPGTSIQILFTSLQSKLMRVQEADNVVPVIICASEERVGATMATINSVHSNTDASVFFYIVTLLRRHDETWKTKLKGIIVTVSKSGNNATFVLQLNFVRFYLPLLDISHKRVIYLDDDVIVQGNIEDLFNVKLKPGNAAAFATDCDLPSTHEMVRSIGMQTTYMGYLDYRKQVVRDLGIHPRDCSFNPGVFVADMNEWKKQKITKQLEKWMEENFRQNIYSSAMAGGVATPPMLIVFHDKYTTLDPLWHVRHLGNSTVGSTFLEEARLLHWNGPFKPWNYPAVHLDLWERWFIPDPSKKFSLVRPERDS